MLIGHQIVLRTLLIKDLDLLYEIENDTELWKYGSEKRMYNRDELLNYIKNSDINIDVAKQYRFAVELHQNAIGFIDLFDYNGLSAGVGLIIHEDFRAKGYGKEALSLLIEHAFFTLDLKELYSYVKEDNLASINLFISSGFTFFDKQNEFNKYILTNN